MFYDKKGPQEKMILYFVNRKKFSPEFELIQQTHNKTIPRNNVLMNEIMAFSGSC